MTIIKSATKIVLLTVTATLCVSVLYMVLTNQLSGDKLAELFTNAVMLIFGFYFAYKGDSNSTYAGK